MSESIDIAPGQQRLFQDRAGRCVLLHKAGIAVSFIMDENGAARVVERIEGIDFKATGSQLKRDGWTCIGPGMAFARLLEPESGGMIRMPIDEYVVYPVSGGYIRLIQPAHHTKSI